MISNRLKVLAEYITPTDIPLDIGCDHGLLDIYLIQNNIVDYAYVSDINQNALDNAINNIKKYNLERYIAYYLSDGLKNIDNKEINALIISGMGTKTIIDILSAKKKLKNIDKLILESNNNYYELRKYITKNGFYIADELIIYENNKYYEVIVAKKGYKKYSLKELMFGPILIKKKQSKKYYEYLLNSYQKILSLVPNKNLKTNIILKIKIKLLESILKPLS